jgi:hypothetical protein
MLPWLAQLTNQTRMAGTIDALTHEIEGMCVDTD